MLPVEDEGGGAPQSLEDVVRYAKNVAAENRAAAEWTPDGAPLVRDDPAAARVT
jgi:hypothetical protein